jgi:hypothetical protein
MHLQYLPGKKEREEKVDDHFSTIILHFYFFMYHEWIMMDISIVSSLCSGYPQLSIHKPQVLVGKLST